MSTPNPLVLPVTAGTIPSGSCPATLQDMLNLFSGNQTVAFPSTFQGIVVSATKPSDTTQTWLQLDTLGRPVRIYQFAQGAWLSQHPLPPGFIVIYPFAAPDFTSFDGGDSNNISAISGPMWQLPVDNSGNPILRGQFPLGAGNIPAPSSTVVVAGTSGGEEKHVLTVPELAPHSHGLNAHTYPYQPGTGVANNIDQTTPPAGTTPITINTQNAGGDPSNNPPNVAAAGHLTMPPWYGVSFLMRTSRLFYSVN